MQGAHPKSLYGACGFHIGMPRLSITRLCVRHECQQPTPLTQGPRHVARWAKASGCLNTFETASLSKKRVRQHGELYSQTCAGERSPTVFGDLLAGHVAKAMAYCTLHKSWGNQIWPCMCWKGVIQIFSTAPLPWHRPSFMWHHLGHQELFDTEGYEVPCSCIVSSLWLLVFAFPSVDAGTGCDSG